MATKKDQLTSTAQEFQDLPSFTWAYIFELCRIVIRLEVDLGADTIETAELLKSRRNTANLNSYRKLIGELGSVLGEFWRSEDQFLKESAAAAAQPALMTIYQKVRDGKFTTEESKAEILAKVKPILVKYLYEGHPMVDDIRILDSLVKKPEEITVKVSNADGAKPRTGASEISKSALDHLSQVGYRNIHDSTMTRFRTYAPRGDSLEAPFPEIGKFLVNTTDLPKVKIRDALIALGCPSIILPSLCGLGAGE